MKKIVCNHIAKNKYSEEKNMKTSIDLRNLLKQIDHKSYPAYKDTKGKYDFKDYV